MDLLSIKQNEKLLEKYRYWNVEDIDWWDSTYDCFKEELKEKGIYVYRMYFSGFWSQGDGACFEGHLDDAQTFLDTNFKPDEYPTIRKLLHAGGSVKFSCEHSGHYYHENCTRFYIEADRFEYVVDASTDFHQQVAESLDRQLDMELTDFERDSTEIFKNFMRKLYRDLEQEYEHLTSDDAVAEAIEANELNDDEGDE